jgi:predicted nucleic acid-binding protein
VNLLADTSAWVEYLRGTGSATHLALRETVRAGSIATTDPVIMELLAGVGSPQREEQLAATLARGRYIACGPEDFLVAARIHASCRRAGSPVRNMLDCLIASVAIREAIPVLHHDRDFEAIARHSTLELA